MVGLFLIVAWPFFLYKKYGNVKYKLEGGTVIAANHYSTYDPFFIWLMYPRAKITFVTIVDVKKKLLPRFVTWLFDCLFIDYEAKNFQFFRDCIDVLKRGEILCIFPEGLINPQKFGFFTFHHSFMFFAKKTNAKVLPLFIYPEVRPFRKSKIYIGDEITPDDYNRFDVENASAYVQSKVMEYSLLVPRDIPSMEELMQQRK